MCGGVGCIEEAIAIAIVGVCYGYCLLDIVSCCIVVRLLKSARGSVLSSGSRERRGIAQGGWGQNENGGGGGSGLREGRNLVVGCHLGLVDKVFVEFIYGSKFIFFLIYATSLAHRYKSLYEARAIINRVCESGG